MRRKKLLILYTEIADYTLACLRELDSSAIEIHLVRWPVNKEAPFQFVIPPHLNVYERSSFNSSGLITFAENLEPDAILCSGWMDKDYLKVIKVFAGKAVTILTMDNKWMGTLRQHAARILARFSLARYFDFIWVPGEQQKKYALKLGFPEKRIRTGFYSADVSRFADIYRENRAEKKKKIPHRFIYAGRYYDFKGVKELWEAFVKYKENSNNNWELWCLGTGDIAPVKHPAIKHLGFVQPGEMHGIMKQCGVFILPSITEPWGVVVHEFAAAGFPLLLSKEVGSGPAFLNEGKNGFYFEPGNSSGIVQALVRISALSDSQLAEMGEYSASKALEISPASWSKILFDLIHSR